MKKISAMRSCIEVLFIGPMLVWQTAKMTIASVRVITHRSQMLAAGPKNSDERREYPRMIQEKIHGGREAVAASMRSLWTAGPAMVETVFAKTVAFIEASFKLMSNGNPAARLQLGISFFRSAVALMYVIPTQIYVFLAAIIFSAAAPLDKRVTANEKRLRAAHKSR